MYNSSSKSRYGRRIDYNLNEEDNNEFDNLKIKYLLEVENKLIANSCDVNELNVGNINLNENTINLEDNEKLILNSKLEIISQNESFIKFDGKNNYEEIFLISKEGINEVELKNIKLKNNTINKLNISILGKNLNNNIYVKEIVGHVKIVNNLQNGLNENQVNYLVNENLYFNDRIEIDNQLNLKIFCIENQNINTKWSVNIKIYTLSF